MNASRKPLIFGGTLAVPVMTAAAALALGTGLATAQSFGLDDNPVAPVFGFPGFGMGAEDPFGIAGFGFPLAPSPSLFFLGPQGDGAWLSPGPFVQHPGPNGVYIDSFSRHHPDMFPNILIQFSVDRVSIGTPGTAVDFEAIAGQAHADIFTTNTWYLSPGIFAGTLPPGPFAGFLPGPAGGPPNNMLTIDDSAFGLQTSGGIVPPGVPVPPPIVSPGQHDNIDSFDNAIFDTNADGAFDIDAYFTLYPDEAFGVGMSPADIVVVAAGDFGAIAVPYASSFMMGLDPFDDSIDALVMYDHNMKPISINQANAPGVVEPVIDYALFSLAPGSLSLQLYGLDAADILFTDFTGAFAVYAPSVSLGLNPTPPGFPMQGESVDAMDVVEAPPVGPVPGMYAVDNAGNFFLIDLNTAAPSLISSGFLCSGAGLQVTELEYNNTTGAGIVQDSNGAFTFNELDFLTGLPNGPTLFNGAAHNGMEWVGGVLYTTSVPGPGGPSLLMTLNPTTGATTVIGPTGASNISGLAYDNTTGTLYGVTAGGAPAFLVAINTATGLATPRTPVFDSASGALLILGSLEFASSGGLYAGGGQINANQLWRINPVTGAAVLVGNTGLGARAITGLASVGGTPCGFVNPSFETGNFSGWLVTDLTNPFFPITVDPSTLLNPFGAPWGSMATHGMFTAFHGFDGNGFSSGFPIELAQDVLITKRGLSFDWRAAWSNGGLFNRTFDVVIEPAGGGIPLQIFNVLTAPGGSFNPDTGQMSALLNMTPYVGSTVRVRFVWTIPEDFTGPAQFQFDNVCITKCGPTDMNGDGFLDNGDIITFVQYFLGGNMAADLNGDGFLDNGDIITFVRYFLAGCV